MLPCTYQTAHKKLSLHYFLYFAVLGTIVPYLALYLHSLGFTPIEIGQLLGVMMVTKVVAPNIWGWLADRSGKHIFWVRLATALTSVASVGLMVFETYWPLFLTILVFSFFWHASLPQFESYTFQCLGNDKHKYGLIRLWGSIGFIASVVVVGWQIEQFDVSLVPLDLLVLSIVVWASSYLVVDDKRRMAVEVGHGFIQILKRPEVISLLVVSFLIQLSHGVYYAFYTIQLTDLGYEKTTIAALWALGVIAEIGIFLWMGQLFKRFPIRMLILVSVWLTALRWVLIGFGAESFTVLFLAQFLHAASFGLFHGAGIYLIDQYFTGRNHGKGQAIFAASSHGLGGAVGMLFAGYLWTWGNAELAYGVSAAMALTALVVGYLGIHQATRKN